MSWWSQLWGDQSDAFNKYAAAQRGLSASYNPWIQRGNNAADLLMQEDQDLLKNPTHVEDNAASHFYLSPYQKNLENNAQQAMNYNAANTGMLGSGAANNALQQQLVDQTGKFQNDYVGNALRSFGVGFNDLGATRKLGYQGLGAQNDLISQANAGQLKADQSAAGWKARMVGAILGGVGGLSSMFPWGKQAGGFLKGFGNGMDDEDDNKSTDDLGG